MESSAPGTVSPQGKFCLRKNGTPQVRVARNPARVRRVVLPSRLTASTRQEFRQSSFHFSERTCCQFPLRVQAIYPFRRKPRDPWGPSAWLRLGPRTSVPFGSSQSRGQWMKKLVTESHVIDLGIETHVGCSNNDVTKTSSCASRSYCACVKKKTRQKRGSNHWSFAPDETF